MTTVGQKRSSHRKAGAVPRRPRLRWLRRVLAILFAVLVALPILLFLLFRFVPVPGTPQMLVSWIGGDGADYRWVAAGRLSPFLARAVIASEDQRFCLHHGFDWQSIDKAVRAHEEGARLRGASTISQQAARSLSCCPREAGSAKAWKRG